MIAQNENDVKEHIDKYDLGSFDDYLYELKKIATTNRKAKTDIGKNIREFNINSDFIEANFLYFRDQYDFGYSPYDVLSQIDTDKSEIFVKLEELSDDIIVSEVGNRCINKLCLDDVDTDDLETELDSRWDKTMVKPYDMTDEEHMEYLNLSDDDVIKGKNFKTILCNLLNLNNSFAYTKEEIIKELIKKI